MFLFSNVLFYFLLLDANKRICLFVLFVATNLKFFVRSLCIRDPLLSEHCMHMLNNITKSLVLLLFYCLYHVLLQY